MGAGSRPTSSNLQSPVGGEGQGVSAPCTYDSRTTARWGSGERATEVDFTLGGPFMGRSLGEQLHDVDKTLWENEMTMLRIDRIVSEYGFQMFSFWMFVVVDL